MPQRTNPFQRLSASIMAVFHASGYIVKESVIEISKKTGVSREIDILITNIKDPSNRIFAECRDHKRKQDVIWIDALDGKSRSLGFKKVIAISSSGFTKNAIVEAKARGIETMRLKEAETMDWKSWLFAINNFGINIDIEPVLRKVGLIGPSNLKPPSLEGVSPKNILLLDAINKKKITLEDYIKGMVKDPKIIDYVRNHNSDESINHYNYDIPCDGGRGYAFNNGPFIPLLKIVFEFDSVRRSYSVPLMHYRAGDRKVMAGEQNIMGNQTKIILEERDGELAVMLESKIQNEKNKI